MIAFISPIISNLLVWFWIIGAVFLWRITRNKRLARILGCIGMLFLWVLPTCPVANIFIKPLESSSEVPKMSSLKARKTDTVVVLTGGGYSLRGELLVSSFPKASAYRFWSGVELATKLGPEYTLIFSGNAGRTGREISTAKNMENLARLLMPGRKILSESQSGSTAEHPGNIKKLTNSDHLIVVTSAFHMKRASASFQRAGLKVVPYPVDFIANQEYDWAGFMPSFSNWRKLNLVFREYLALALYEMKGW